MRGAAALLAVAATLAGCGSPKPIFRGVESDPLPSRSAVENLARPWLGTPYRYGGGDRRGIDCSALAQNILGDLGADLPRTVRAQKEIGREIPVRDMEAGDLVFFRLESTRVNHVGIAVGPNRFVHASKSRGVVIDHLMDDYFSRRFAEARRVLR